jgi:hypothetical protein
VKTVVIERNNLFQSLRSFLVFKIVQNSMGLSIRKYAWRNIGADSMVEIAFSDNYKVSVRIYFISEGHNILSPTVIAGYSLTGINFRIEDVRYF